MKVRTYFTRQNILFKLCSNVHKRKRVITPIRYYVLVSEKSYPHLAGIIKLEFAVFYVIKPLKP